MLRPEWRLWPISTFLGVTDLKTGVIIALLFAVSLQVCFHPVSRKLITPQLLNKVAGIYGLIATLMGAVDTFAQISLYIYSVLGLVVLSWGLKSVKDVRIISRGVISR